MVDFLSLLWLIIAIVLLSRVVMSVVLQLLGLFLTTIMDAIGVPLFTLSVLPRWPDVCSSTFAMSHVVHGLNSDLYCTVECVLYLFAVGIGRSYGRCSIPGGEDAGRDGVSLMTAEDAIVLAPAASHDTYFSDEMVSDVREGMLSGSRCKTCAWACVVGEVASVRAHASDVHEGGPLLVYHSGATVDVVEVGGVFVDHAVESWCYERCSAGLGDLQLSSGL